MVRGAHADPVYPPSLYKAISYASTLGVPVYILENGMPSKEDDSRRSDWINGCLAEVQLGKRGQVESVCACSDTAGVCSAARLGVCTLPLPEEHLLGLAPECSLPAVTASRVLAHAWMRREAGQAGGEGRL